MEAILRLYDIDNKTIKRTINIEDTLYKELMTFVNCKYDATFSEIVNICIEDYINKNNPTFYEKTKLESITYRSIMIRKNNLEGLYKMYKATGISVTRLLNAAIKDFLEKYNK